MDIGRVAQLCIEPGGAGGKRSHLRGIDNIALDEGPVAELIFAARLDAWLHVAQPFAAPEAEQDAVIFDMDQYRQAIGRKDEIAPFDALLEGRSGENGCA
jgi:hypothetical protein